jgi:hypothetical protein
MIGCEEYQHRFHKKNTECKACGFEQPMVLLPYNKDGAHHEEAVPDPAHKSAQHILFAIKCSERIHLKAYVLVFIYQDLITDLFQQFGISRIP